MRWPVVAHQSCPVQTHHHRQPLQRHIMYQLVVGPLHKRRIDIAERGHPLRRQPGGKRHCMLLGNAHIERPRRHLLHHDVERATRRHSGRDTHDAVVLLSQFHNGVAKHILIFQRLAVRIILYLHTRLGVEQSRRMIGDRILLGGAHPLALLGNNMQQLGTLNLLQLCQHLHQLVQIVAVDGTEIAEAQRLEQIGGTQCRRLGHKCGALQEIERFCSALTGIQLVAAQLHPHLLFQLVVFGRCRDAGQVAAQSAHCLVDADTVVVQHHQHVGTRHSGIVQTLKSLAPRHRAVANHRYMLTLRVALQLRGHSHSQSRTHRCGTVTRTECVKLRFVHAWKTADAAIGADGGKLIATSGNNLVAIRLVAHIPYQFIVGGIENIVQRQRQLHRAEARSQMTRVLRKRIDNIMPQLYGQLFQIVHREFP